MASKCYDPRARCMVRGSTADSHPGTDNSLRLRTGIKTSNKYKASSAPDSQCATLVTRVLTPHVPNQTFPRLVALRQEHHATWKRPAFASVPSKRGQQQSKLH